MADARLCVGFSSACKQAREGGGLPAYEPLRSSRGRCLRPFLPPDLVRLIDAMVLRLEHEDRLLRMNGGELGTTLCGAAGAGGLLDVRFLLARGADVEATTVFVDGDGDHFWRTALAWAANSGHFRVCVELLDAGAVQDDELLQAAEVGHTHIVALLLDRGADLHYEEDLVLYTAVSEGHLETARLLLDRGAHIRAGGYDALRVAAARGQIDIVRLLLDRGAEVGDGRALLRAREEGHAAVVALLLERGAPDV